jgi:hypothetical protein
VSTVAALAMIAGALSLGADADQDDDTATDRANTRAVLLDTGAGAVAATGVAVTDVIILTTNG